VKFFSKNETIPQTILNIIPEDTARHYKFIAFNKEGNNLEIGMVYPDDLKAQEAVKFIASRLNLNLKVYLITLSDLKEILKQYQGFVEEFNKLVEDFKKDLLLLKKILLIN